MAHCKLFDIDCDIYVRYSWVHAIDSLASFYIIERSRNPYIISEQMSVGLFYTNSIVQISSEECKSFLPDSNIS